MQAERIARTGKRSEREKKYPGKRRKRPKRPLLCGDVLSTLQQRFSVVTSEEHAYSDSGVAEVHRLREKKVREDITHRLRGVCSNFSDDEFDQLVRLMAARQVRCERRQSW